MSKTREVIARHLDKLPDGWWERTASVAADDKASEMIAALDAAGFVILPKEPDSQLEFAGAVSRYVQTTKGLPVDTWVSLRCRVMVKRNGDCDVAGIFLGQER